MPHRLINIIIIALAISIATTGVVYAQLAGNKRFTVYDGVISIAGSNDVMQIGNAGRDITSTGKIYIRPGKENGVFNEPSGAGTYFVAEDAIGTNIQHLYMSGDLYMGNSSNVRKICLYGTGSEVCNDQWPTGGTDSDWTVSGDDMWSTPTGNVGIGTTSPNRKLQIQSSGEALRLSGGTDTTNNIAFVMGRKYNQIEITYFVAKGDNNYLTNGQEGDTGIRVQDGNKRFHMMVGTGESRMAVANTGVAIGANYAATDNDHGNAADPPQEGLIIQGSTG
ncbi:MAG: hypothetical protein V1838_01075, partial [Patescibacteria group bacterium]